MIMSTKNYVSLGIMSGTSQDGLDLSIVETDGEDNLKFLGGYTVDFPDTLKISLRSILGSHKRDSVLNIIEKEYTDFVIKKLKKIICLNKKKIDLIGFHGQTITHLPNKGFSWQIGNAQRIFSSLKIPIIYDFRTNDIVNGGNGAPLTPIFHKLIKTKFNMKNVAFLNLGGISNITILSGSKMIAFDCGPCCNFSNIFVRKKINKKFDKNGLNAQKGITDKKILAKLLKNPYFSKIPPKSLDRLDIKFDEIFNLSLKDGLSTINDFITETIYLGIRKYINKLDQIILVGGGRKNIDLIQKLKSRIKIKIDTSENLKIDGDLFEASAFGYLAVRSLKKKAISYPHTTGVDRPLSGGKLLK